MNNAGVTLLSRFEEALTEEYRRVFETNLFGYVYGARAALSYFREQGSGVLINNDSVVARASQPYTSAYVTSKFAVRGLSECLREEFILDGAKDTHVCLSCRPRSTRLSSRTAPIAPAGGSPRP